MTEQSNPINRLVHLNPDGMMKSPAFSQAIVVPPNARTIYVGGQDAVDADGKIVGEGDLRAQTEQVLHNVQTALAAAGAGWEDVVKLNIFIVQGQSALVGFEVFQRFWGGRANPPTITVVFVAALGNPAFLLEIDAVAVKA